MAKAKTIYVCNECGYETSSWMGKCAGCGAWNTLTEQQVEPASSGGGGARARSRTPFTAPLPVGAIEKEETPYISTGIAELDRVLSGGLVAGGVVLIGGEPGVGKSTLLLQASNQ